MDLECYLARQFALGVFQGHAEGPVDSRPDPVPDGEDLVAVPVAGLDRASRVLAARHGQVGAQPIRHAVLPGAARHTDDRARASRLRELRVQLS